MKILVTGGAGYIGSHTVYALIEAGHKVVIVDNLVTGHKEALHPQATFYETSIADYHSLVDILTKENPDGVIHFAAFSLVGESMTDPFKYYDNNVAGTNVLLAAMADCGIMNIVFSSTAAIYGHVKTMPITEKTPTNPTNVYGETKLAMEKMIDWHAKAKGLGYVSLRYFNVAGAHESGQLKENHNPETHLIPIILEVANGSRPEIGVFGHDYDTPDGTCIRDYIHVVDLADAHIRAMQYLLDGGENNIFNLGNGQGFSVLEIIEATRKVTNHPIPQVVLPRRQGDPAKLIASSEKAKKILNWTPKYVNIQDIIDTAWKTYGESSL